MDTSQSIRILLAVLCYANFGNSLELKQQMILKNTEQCLRLARDPYFDIEQVVGKSWRIYYTWHMAMEDKCLDVTIKNATAMIVNRIYHDMYEYLEVQPNWEAATLHLSMGSPKHEMLLIADQGAAGTFIAVPNVVRDDLHPNRGTVPVLSFFLKLLGDKYLLLADCKIGVVTLSSREKPPFRAEVASLANSLGLGEGQPACISDKRKDEIYSSE